MVLWVIKEKKGDAQHGQGSAKTRIFPQEVREPMAAK